MTIRVFGEGLDALTFATHLTRNDIDFHWLVANDRLGGFFRGSTNCFNNPIDVGMVLMEPNTYGTTQKDLIHFQGEWAQNARPYLDHSYDFAKNIMGDYTLPLIGSKIEEVMEVPDYFISDRLEAFWNYRNQEMINQISENLEWLEKNPNWHPRNKNSESDIFNNVGILDYFIRIYGGEFYKVFFKQYLENLLGKEVNSLLTVSHRRAWIPLYWPETVLESLVNNGKAVHLFTPVFVKPKCGSVAKWIHDSVKEILASTNAKIIKSDFLDLKDFDYFSSETDFAFIDQRSMQNNSTERVIMTTPNLDLRIVHFCGEVLKSRIVFLGNNNFGCFRVSTSEGGSMEGGLTLEFGNGSIHLTDSEIMEKSKKIINNFEFDASCDGKIFRAKFQINTPIDGMHNDLPSITFHSNTLHNSKSLSFNDNIVRSAWAAEIVGGIIDV